jgi:hypothetical protein
MVDFEDAAALLRERRPQATQQDGNRAAQTNDPPHFVPWSPALSGQRPPSRATLHRWLRHLDLPFPLVSTTNRNVVRKRTNEKGRDWFPAF